MPYLTNRRHSSNNIQTKSRWRASKFIRSQDSFGKEVPSFNLEGDTQVRTLPGGFVTLTILTVTLAYAITKFADLSQGRNPNITESFVSDYYSSKDEFNLATDTNFRLALGMRWTNFP